MGKLKLKNLGYPWMIIVDGTKRIGRTYRSTDGRYCCVIDRKHVYTEGTSHEHAFREGAARYLGHASAAALAAHNEAVASRREEARQQMNALVRGYHAATPEQRAAAWEAIMDRVLK